MRTKDQYKFEEQLVRTCELHDRGQMIIVDDRALTLSSIDLHLGKLKAKYKDKFTLAVVDYLNQIVVPEGSDQFDWKPQILISKKLKDLARKHDIVIVSPYQIDESGQTRFAKGILDAPDIALLMEANAKEDNAISFETTKIRGGPSMKFTSGMDWETLRIDPIPRDKPEVKDKIKRAGKESKKTEENAGDLPWD